MGTKYKILIMGASYGSLLGTKLALAGHAVHLICLPAEAELINKEGAIVRMPVKGRDGLVEINSKKLPGRMAAGGTAGVNPSDYHLVALAMQEPQYRSPGVRELLVAVAKAKVPCMSIMNMPPLPYLKRIPGIDADALRSCYTDASVWDAFDPKLVTLCSPDPQAFRPPRSEEHTSELQSPCNLVCRLLLEKKKTSEQKQTDMLRTLFGKLYFIGETKWKSLGQQIAEVALQKENLEAVQVFLPSLTCDALFL